MQAAIGALRTRHPRRIVVAVPVASQTGSTTFRDIADEFICDNFPEPFGHVGVWYKDFSRPADDRLAELIPDRKSNAP
jgi:predicted phosphoribosyltransferase